MAPSPKKATATLPVRLADSAAPVAAPIDAADDAEAAHQAVLEVDDVHRSRAAAADAGGAAEHLGHQPLGVGAGRERVAVAAVGAGDPVARLERGADADRDRLLAGVEVGRAVHLAAQEQPVDLALEQADQQHAAVPLEHGALGPRVGDRHAPHPAVVGDALVAQAVGHRRVLGHELEAGRAGLQLEQRGEVDVAVAVARSAPGRPAARRWRPASGPRARGPRRRRA